MTSNRAPGAVMVDLQGRELTEQDRKRLLHPMTGGVILFSRNFESPEQISALTEEIRALRNPPLLIAVDQEGGRVQRFKTGFTRLPAMRLLGKIWDDHPEQACELAHRAGFVLASELRVCGVDLSFAPVLDLDFGGSAVIGDRAFHADPAAVCELACALVDGLRRGGMAACGKHFPGHGFVTADSHVDVPVDERSFAQIEAADMVPFRKLIRHGLSSIMPAHVIYSQSDAKPAGFSAFWLQKVLRGDLAFKGTIFSDDLSMEGARVAGGVVQRADVALQAGCDMVLVCNRPEAVDELLAGLVRVPSTASQFRLQQLYGQRTQAKSITDLQSLAFYAQAVQEIATLDPGEIHLTVGTRQVGELG